ncbi:hypothetical protein ACFV0O_22860 [Kitasatospora sp. NPDC059577]
MPQRHQGTPMTTTLVLIMVPGVLAGAALRPGRGQGRGRAGRS